MSNSHPENIYLDYAASTPVDSRTLTAMMPYFSEIYGNPSSVHMFGQRAEAALEDSRQKVSRILNCRPQEIIFTSCGSESDNFALRGIAFASRRTKNANHILISPVEHHAISLTARQLVNNFGFEVEILPVDQYGMVNPADIAARLRSDTALVSVIYANNEIGTINPISEIGEICRKRGVLFHTDAVQAAAYLPIVVDDLNVDLLSLGAHKFYGPKGIGALYSRKQNNDKSTSFNNIDPIITGGGQEFGLRAGTSNIPLIVGLAESLVLTSNERLARTGRLQPLRDHLINEVLTTIPEASLTGHPTNRMPNHASFVFRGVDGNKLLMMLDLAGFACSSGSACKTGNPEPSDVLTALGLERDWSLGSLRVTLGMGTTEEHISRFLKVLPDIVKRVRQLSLTTKNE